MACGELEYIEGGTLRSATIVAGSMSGTAVSNCSVDGCTLTSLTGIDSVSAHRIATAIAGLSSEELAILANALVKAMTAKGVEPSNTEKNVLPTTLYGSHSAALGKPTGWLNIGGYSVPGYI